MSQQLESRLSLESALRKFWGYDSFRPLQREAMQCVLDGRDSVVVLPTGGGKSLCFQAPAVCLDGLAVVVSPLISLMKDQVDALRACGVPAACINSTMSHQERRKVADDIRGNRLRLLYVAPERLVQDRTLDFLQSSNVSLVAIDEAHCISEWGHDFRPEYRAMKILKEAFPDLGIHAYTATATERVRADIARELKLAEPEILVGSFDRPNLYYRVEQRRNRLGQICEILDRHKGESGVVYCISRKAVDETSASLNALGYRTLPYHAGMADEDRKRNQEAFIQEKVDTIVATVAFGMGIDKSNVRYVVHAGMPKSLEAYQQESGRAGRDGLEAECVLLYSAGDPVQWRKMLNGSAAPGAQQTLKAMENYCTGLTCRHRALVNYFGQDLDVESCGACDVCLGDLDLVPNALVIGQKILSSVIRQEQRFGGEYTTLVLKGSKDQRVLQNRHDRLSTYGLLSDVDQKTIRGWIEQLVSQSFLEKTGEFNVLQVTPRGRQLLRGEATPKLLRPKEKSKTRREEIPTDSWEGVDRELFDSLRVLRREQADLRGVPAYIVFGDATLREMARRRPSTVEGFRGIKGVGEKKAADYGDVFVERIVSHCREHQLPMDLSAGQEASPESPDCEGPTASALAAFPFFRRGASVEETAETLKRARSTVTGYLLDYLRHERVCDPSPWVDAETVRRITAAAEEVGAERLKPIFERLDGAVSYDAIRITLRCQTNASEV